VVFTACLNGSQELCTLIYKSIGTSTRPLVEKFMTKLKAEDPGAQLSYQYPLLTIQHGTALTKLTDLELADDRYKIRIEKNKSNASTTVMRFEYISNKQQKY